MHRIAAFHLSPSEILSTSAVSVPYGPMTITMENVMRLSNRVGVRHEIALKPFVCDSKTADRRLSFALRRTICVRTIALVFKFITTTSSLR